MDGNWNGASPNVKNKYQYGDKELQTDFGLNWNDFGARSYDAAIGRFTTADPMADFRSWVSPYQYVQNNPINRIDPTGMIDKGADGMTNEQWMKASNPANNGSQAASTAYNGSNHAKTNYENQKAENEYAAAHGGARRPVTGNDVAASGSGSNIVWEGFYSGEFNTVTGFHLDCACGGAGQPPCKGVTYKYNRKNPSDYGARWPDFYSLNVGIPISFLVSPNVAFTMDRHFQWYISPGAGVGIPSGRSFSLTASWLTQPKKPTPTQMYSFLSGFGMGIGAGYGLGGVWNASLPVLSSNPYDTSGPMALGFGIMTPQFGWGYSYTPDFLIFNRK